DNRPVNTTPPEDGKSTTAPNNGCSPDANPKPAASTAAPSPDSQKRCRSNAYVGNSTNPAPGSTARQSTPTPDTNACAHEVRNVRFPPSLRPRVGITIASVLPSVLWVTVSSIPLINAGCGLGSMKVR